MSRIRRVPPHQIALETAKRLIKHYPHDPVEMLSGNSTPPVYMWICPINGCSRTQHTYVRGEIPVCAGGYPSRVTQILDAYDF